jgi:tetratricopeptide (TPR) repeat protein
VFDASLRPQPFAATGKSSGLDWSPDGGKLAAGELQGTVTVYDAATASRLHVLRHAARHVLSVRWHPSMPRLASTSADGTVRIWDTATGQEVGMLEAHSSWVRGLDWSPNGWRLAAAGFDSTVRVWDASPAVRYFERHEDLRDRVLQLVGEYEPRVGKGAMREEFDEALELLRRLRALHPEDKELDWQIQHVEWFRATQLARAGQTDEAIAIFQRLAAESPDLPDYRLHLPAALFEAAKEAQAIEMLEKTVDESPTPSEYREELAYLYERRAIQLCVSDQIKDAIPILRKLGTDFPERPGHRSQLVRQLTAQVTPEKAIEVLRTLSQEFPDAAEYRQAEDRH